MLSDSSGNLHDGRALLVRPVARDGDRPGDDRDGSEEGCLSYLEVALIILLIEIVERWQWRHVGRVK